MARIAGVNLPNQKRLEIGLTYIYGIGQPTARKVAAELGLNPDTKVKDLTDEEITKLREYIDGNLQVEGDLRRERTQAVKRLGDLAFHFDLLFLNRHFLVRVVLEEHDGRHDKARRRRRRGRGLS